MLIVRPFEASDKLQIELLKEKSGFQYDSPDWGNLLVSGVVEENGQVTMAAFLRKTAEVYFVMDSEHGRKRGRVGQLLALHREMIQPARFAGFTDAHCWMPPEIAQRFGKLLMHFGWTRPLWPNYHFVIPESKSHG